MELVLYYAVVCMYAPSGLALYYIMTDRLSDGDIPLAREIPVRKTI